MSSASLGDASLFMDDMDLFALKGEDDASLRSADAMDFPVSSLELVQLLACDDDDIFIDSSVVGDDVFGRHDQQYLAADDLSDAVTDDASSDMAASPPPTFGGDDDAQQLSAPSSPAIYGFASTASSPSPSVGGSVGAAKPPPQRSLAVKLKLPPTPVSPPAATTATAPSPMKTSMPSTAAVLPFAFPVACFPPLNCNLKRPLPDVLPNQPAAALDPVEHKKSKRALRQMKNRESANRSRLRRKAQLSDLSSEVDELTKKQHELQNTVAALQAENKSLHDQNAFLRSLVTMYSDPTRTAALPPVPSFVQRPPPQVPLRASVSLCDLESGAPCDEEDEDDDEDDDELAVVPTPKKQRKSLGRSAATISAASLGLCASMFGLTILTDSEHGAAQSSHIRRPGRVLHSLPSTAGDQGGCLPSPVAMVVERLWESCSSSWAFLTTSELAYGVFLNVLSFVVIMALYHCFQQHYASSSLRSSKRTFRWQNMGPSACHRRGTAAAKRRSVSWQDARVDSEADAPTPRVQVFT